MVKSHFASPERCSEKVLEEEIASISHSPVLDGILQSANGLLAILNEQRQVVALNETLLEITGVKDAESIFGMRLGEAIRCVHAHEEPGGCGTSRYCISCGAAIAMVSSLSSDKPVTRTCAATVDQNGKTEELCFQVQSIPIRVKDTRFLLIFLTDITRQQSWASIEKVFLHDINNVLTGITCTSELLALRYEDEYLVRTITRLLSRLKKDVDIQRTLSNLKENSYTPDLREVSISELFEEIQFNFLNNPVSSDRSLAITQTSDGVTLKTDYSLLFRVLTNMVSNAFEATDPGGTVRLWYVRENQQITFFVWNHKVIPQDVQLRVFQHHFSTKTGLGRGIGTYAMKLLGEDILGGSVSFTSSDKNGTVFYIRMNQSES